METGDDDYSTETESELSFGAVDFDQILQEAEARRVSPRESIRKAMKKQKPEHKLRAVLPSNLHSIVIMDKHITKALYGQDYEYNHRSSPAHAEESSREGAKVGEGEREAGGEAPDQRHGL
jgi:hypothetical protein